MTEAQVQATLVEGVAVVRLTGEVDFGNVADVEAAIRDTVTNGVSGLVIDLSVVGYLDSAALRMLFAIARHLEASRQPAALVVQPDSPVRSLLAVTHLHAAMPAHETVDGAVSAVRAPADRPRP